jgi:hypothetical protein
MIITGDGRIALTFVDSSRKSPATASPSDLEAAQLWRTMFSYVGTIQFDQTPTETGLKITIRSEVSSNPAVEGLDRVFFAKREGNNATRLPRCKASLPHEDRRDAILLPRQLRYQCHRSIASTAGAPG